VFCVVIETVDETGSVEVSSLPDESSESGDRLSDPFRGTSTLNLLSNSTTRVSAAAREVQEMLSREGGLSGRREGILRQVMCAEWKTAEPESTFLVENDSGSFVPAMP
jgi:hypothetical protein